MSSLSGVLFLFLVATITLVLIGLRRGWFLNGSVASNNTNKSDSENGQELIERRQGVSFDPGIDIEICIVGVINFSKTIILCNLGGINMYTTL